MTALFAILVCEPAIWIPNQQAEVLTLLAIVGGVLLVSVGVFRLADRVCRAVR